MTFNPNAQLDPSQVEDRRGAPTGIGSGYSGGGFRVPIVVGGGGAGLVLTLIIIAINVFGGALTSSNSVPADGSAAGYQGAQVQSSNVDQKCRTGADANSRTDCLVVGVVNSVQAYWSAELPKRGVPYTQSDTILYSGATQAGCGLAQSAEGPFYCPTDKKVYLDLSFFDELHARFGAQGGHFADAYVIAHEYGHHVQDLLGLLSGARGSTAGQAGGSVRTELQADCFAGVWASHAVQTGYLEQPSQSEIAQAVDAAGAVGDDRIQQQTQGRVTPDSFTHGSAQQRQRWFTTGYQAGDLAACDTSTGNL